MPNHAVYDAICAALDGAELTNPVFAYGPTGLPAKGWNRLNPGVRMACRSGPMAVVTGSGLLVIDVDNKKEGEDGFETLEAREEEWGHLPETFSVRSRSGKGLHLYFRVGEAYASPIGSRPQGIGVGIDIRCEGSHVVMGEAVECDEPIAELPPLWASRLPLVGERSDVESRPVEYERRSGADVLRSVESALRGKRSDEIVDSLRLVVRGEPFARAAGGSAGPPRGAVEPFVFECLQWLARDERIRSTHPDDMNSLWAASMSLLRAEDERLGNAVFDHDHIARAWVRASEYWEGVAQKNEELRRTREEYLAGRREGRSKVEGADVDWVEKLERGDRGIKGSVANVVMALELAPELSGLVYRNERSGYIFLEREAPWFRPPHTPTWIDNDIVELGMWLSLHGLRASKAVIQDAVLSVAMRRSRDPWVEYLRGVQWDGRPRLDTWLIDHCGARDTEFVRAVSSCWMISAVARSLCPGAQVDSMLILEGRQGTRKTSLLRELAGHENFGSWSLDLTSKDAVLALIEPVIIEMGELEALKGKDSRKVKSWLTKRRDDIRRPYATNQEPLPRRCVFAGTTNESSYLTDFTGARRFWPVAIERCDVEGVVSVKDQLWAEARERYESGEQWWLTDDLVAQQEREAEHRRDDHLWEDTLELALEDVRDIGGEYRVGPLQHRICRQQVKSGQLVLVTRATLLEILELPVGQRGGKSKTTLTECMSALGWSDTWEDGTPVRIDYKEDGFRVRGRGFRKR